MITVKRYQTADGKQPFSDWIDKLKDKLARGVITARITRLEAGLFGDSKSIGNGVHELRIRYGPGYRVYYGKDGKTLILLLSGGDKRSQTDDIKKAKAYWKDYRQTRR